MTEVRVNPLESDSRFSYRFYQCNPQPALLDRTAMILNPKPLNPEPNIPHRKQTKDWPCLVEEFAIMKPSAVVRFSVSTQIAQDPFTKENTLKLTRPIAKS